MAAAVSAVRPCCTAAKAQNEPLLRQLLSQKGRGQGAWRSVFPSYWLHVSEADNHHHTDVACSCAAMAAGDPRILQLLLTISSIAMTSFKMQWLLCYAARRSNAACMRVTLFTRVACHATGKYGMTAAAEHVAMAAARTDPWATGKWPQYYY